MLYKVLYRSIILLYYTTKEMIGMTVINLEETLMGFDRYNGGWVKTITALDKDYQNGYSLQGDFVANKRVKNVDLKENTLYLDCSIGGSRKNPEKNYHLFKFEDGEIEIIQTIEDGQQDWALLLWDNVEKELGLQKTQPEMVMEEIRKLNPEEFLELMDTLKDYSKYKLFLMEELVKGGINPDDVSKLMR